MRLPARLLTLFGLLSATGFGARAQPLPLDPASATIPQLQAAMQSGRLSAAALVRFYLARIARLDTGPGGLHAVLAINPHAEADAAALDAERAAHGPRGPLHGIPILVKDNIDSAGGLPTTAGSLALAGNFRPDAPLIARLRRQGAIILGKTNLSEWANYRSSNASSGWSAVGGLTRNPYALDRTACGSSSGSAAAVAAGFAPAAIGTETDGSITCPASMQGLVGLKPSVGMIPRTGIVPIAHSQDTPGPITHDVADAALLMAAMAGPDRSDPQSLDAPDLAAAFHAVRPATLAGLRVGVWRYPPNALPMVDPLYQATLARLRAAGLVLVEVPMPDTTQISQNEAIVLKTEIKADMAQYLSASPASVGPRSLADLIAFNQAHPAELAWFGQDLFLAAEQTHGLADPAYLTALAAARAAAGPDGIDRILRADHLAAILAPTTGPAWKIDLIDGDNGGIPAASTLPAVAGTPHLTLPMGLVHGLPVGLSVIGPRFADASVLGIGAALQASLPPIAPPGFPPTLAP